MQDDSRDSVNLNTAEKQKNSTDVLLVSTGYSFM